MHLWKIFHDDSCDIYTRALAGLCLRCYISHAIAKTCKIISNSTFRTDTHKPFTYHDLLPYVLNDDGKNFIILDRDGKTQLVFKEDGSTQAITNKGNYQSIEILRTYNPNLSQRESLDNWAIRFTQQNRELKKFLLEYRVRIPSDWSLLCKDIPNSLKSHLQHNEREILEVFHQVYRRDRRLYGQTGKCATPTIKQLQEMLYFLQKRDITLKSHEELIGCLKGIAYILRQDMYSTKLGTPQAESLDVGSQIDNDNYSVQVNLPPGAYLDPVLIEWQELLNVISNLFIKVLSQAIAQKIPEKVSDLRKSKAYSSFANKFPEGLGLYYQKSNPLSIHEIANLWSIDRVKTRRIFNLKQLLKTTEYLTEEILLQNLIENPVDSRLNSISKSPEKLKIVAEATREYIYDMAFKEAFAEINSGKYRSRNSLFAQRLRQYLNHTSKKCSRNKSESVTKYHNSSDYHAEFCTNKNLTNIITGKF
ncbi:MAG: hypothetical protein AAFX80_07155 [Cyanobacteria bacterium J06639_18]